MNAVDGKFGLAVAAFVVAGAMSGCVSRFEAATDATSPIAPRVQALVDANRDYPRWADFPRALEPAPQPSEIAAQVNTLRVTGGALAGEVSRLEWTVTDAPEVLAAEARARVDSVPVSPVTQETQAEIDAFVRRTRERGRAPPPVDRR